MILRKLDLELAPRRNAINLTLSDKKESQKIFLKKIAPFVTMLITIGKK